VARGDVERSGVAFGGCCCDAGVFAVGVAGFGVLGVGVLRFGVDVGVVGVCSSDIASVVTTESDVAICSAADAASSCVGGRSRAEAERAGAGARVGVAPVGVVASERIGVDVSDATSLSDSGVATFVG